MNYLLPDSSRPLPLIAASLWLLTASASAQLNEDRELTANDAVANAYLGSATAAEGGFVLAGARGDDDNGAGSGSAYLFAAASGAQLVKYVAADGAAGDNFGQAVALAGDFVVVGAPLDDDNGGDSGSAYVFDRASGTQLAKLTPNDGAAGDQFGCAVAIEGQLVAVGAKFDDDNGANSGSLYVFDATTGAQLRKVLPTDGDSLDWFGEALDMDGGILAVGAHGDEANGPLSGSAYLFDPSTGAQLAKLLALDGASNQFLGTAIAIDDGIVVVGAWADSIFYDHSGSAYLFDASTGAQITKLVPADGHDRDHFGFSVAIEGNLVAIGADEDDDSAFDAGSAYLYDTSGTQLAKILASDGANFDNFGTSIAVNGDRVAIGAPRTNDGGDQSGSVYVVDLGGTLGTPFCAGDGSAASCPCSNAGAPEGGCANSVTNGATLVATGSASVAADDLELVASASKPGAPGLFFQGTGQVASGQGLAFGDGLRCVGGSVVRLQIVAADATGTARTSVSIVGAGNVPAGQTRYYQWWYRDPVGSPCGTGFNLSNGLAIQWQP